MLRKLYYAKTATFGKAVYGSTYLIGFLFFFYRRSTFQILNQTQSKTYGHTRIDGKTYGHARINGKGTQRSDL